MIPRKIFQTFEQKSFEPEFQKIVDYWKTENPDFKYCLYDDNEREEFIKNNFPAEVYGAYMRIIPQAFKADLWRYCVLYTYGGFYADIDTACLGGLERFINSDTEFVAPIDLNLGDLEFHNICNGFIGSIPNHPILKKCIDRIVLSVKKQEMPSENIMNFSGPGRLGIAVNQYLNRPDKETMVNFEGIYSKVHLIKFEHGLEYVRDLDGKKILQSKSGAPFLKHLYEFECKKIKNHFDWGKLGFKNVPFEQIVQTDPFTISAEITTIDNYHNGKPASFNLYKYCGISDCIRRGWRWEEHQHEVIDKYLNKDSIAIEVGAHIGTLTIKLSKVAKQVYAFEPMEITYSMLERNLLLNDCKNVKTYNKGVGDKISSVNVKWISANNSGGTGLAGGYLTKDNNLQNFLHIRIDKEKKVDLVDLDSMDFGKVDFLKIDAEGYEELVVKGAENLIKENMPLIILECFGESTFNTHSFDPMIPSEKEVGRRYASLYGLGYIHEHVSFDDFLFIPPRLQN